MWGNKVIFTGKVFKIQGLLVNKNIGLINIE